MPKLSGPSTPRNTLSDAEFATSIAGYAGSDRKTTSMRKTHGVLDPFAFGRPLPLVSTQEKPPPLQNPNKLFRFSYLHGFVMSDFDCFVEFTSSGPRIFQMGVEGPFEVSASLLDELFVQIGKDAAWKYSRNGRQSRKLCSALSATDPHSRAELFATVPGFDKTYQTFFRGFFRPDGFRPLVRLSMRRASFTLLPDHTTAFNLHWGGRAVFSSNECFCIDRDIGLSLGFDSHAQSYYIGSGDGINNLRRLWFAASSDGRLYLG
jgi:hypothetical protein